MEKKTIVLGGKLGYQAPASLVYRVPTTRLDGKAWRILLWMLWEAHARSRWRRVEEPQVELEVRYHAQDMLGGAGLIGEKGYRGLRVALEQLQAVRFHGEPDPLILGFVERPGPHFDVVLSAAIAAEHARPLGRYALLNLEHIRRLRQPLDFAVYARACLVARAREPRFHLRLDEIAWICGTKQDLAWRTLRRQILPAFTRVCAATGGRIVIQAWCEGDYHGIDHLLCHVGMAGDGFSPRFTPRRRAIFFDVGPTGAAPLAAPSLVIG